MVDAQPSHSSFSPEESFSLDVQSSREEQQKREELAAKQVLFLARFGQENNQVNPSDQVEFVYAGSLNFGPLSQAVQLVVIPTEQAHSPKATLPLSPEVRQKFFQLVRPVGDLDIAISSFKSPGGARIAAGSVPQGIFKHPHDAQFLSADIVNSGFGVTKPITEAARVVVDSQEIFLSTPLDILAHKVVDAMTSLHTKPLGKDLAKIQQELRALREIVEHIYKDLPTDLSAEMRERIARYFDSTEEAFADNLRKAAENPAELLDVPEEFMRYLKEIFGLK